MRALRKVVPLVLALAVLAAAALVAARRGGDAGPGAPPGPAGPAAAPGAGGVGRPPDVASRVGMAPSDAPPARLLWRFDAGAAFEYPPLAADGRVFAASENDTLWAFDARSGKLLWRHRPARGRLWPSSLAVSDGALYVGSEGGVLTALDPADGRVLWQRTLAGEAMYSPTPRTGVLYAATTFVAGRIQPDVNGKARVYALKPSDGSVIWERATDNFSLRTVVPAGNTLYVGGGFQSPKRVDEGGHFRLYALRAEDGATRWTYESQDGWIKTLHASGDGPGDTVVFSGYRDHLVALAADSGRPKWEYNTENWTDGFAAEADRLWFSSANGFIHALDVNTGRVLWKERLDGVFKYADGWPVLRDGVLYFRTTYDELYAMDAATGRVRWRGLAGVPSHSAVAVGEGEVSVGSTDGNLYAFERKR